MMSWIFENPSQICWLCAASKGAADISTVYTDLSEEAGWRSTYLFEVPWENTPSYASLPGFATAMIVGDLLHVVNLGVGRDLAGTILRTILGDRTVFSGSTLEDRMEEAYVSLRAYARNNGHNLKLKKFTRNRLTWKSNRYPELVAQGSDVHIICTWLEEVLSQHAEQYQQFMTMLSAANRALRLLYSAGPFPTRREKDTVRVLGELFAKSFVQLSAEAVQNNALLWRCRPKFHVLTEFFLMRRSINPVMYSTWMDEDFLRKLSHTLRLTSNRTAQTRILQRWLMAIPEQLHRVRQPN